MDEMIFTLNGPITEEQRDMIEDADFDHTESITFHTKHGKEVEFVKRKTGKWICIDNGDGFPDWLCSECGKSGRGDYSYCPWCNADMSEVQDESN